MRDKAEAGKCSRGTVESFRSIFEHCEDNGDDHAFLPKETFRNSHWIHSEISIEEIQEARDRLCNTTAPGLDKVTVEDIKSIEPTDLACLFNIFLMYKDVPKALKVNKTTMIPKVFPPGDSDWRPITIASIVDRLFGIILERRLSDTVMLHSNQRGFLKRVDGCGENITVYGSALRMARREGKSLVVVSLDLAKAFDSVKYSSVSRALMRLGLDIESIKLFSNLCQGQTTTIEFDEGKENVKLNKGVRQGWPLSPLLFLCVIDELLCELSWQDGFRVSDEDLMDGVLTGRSFADDLNLYSASPLGMQQHINKAEKWCVERGIAINPKKSTVLYLEQVPKQKKVKISPLDISINGDKIPMVFDSYERILGVHMNCNGEVDYREGKLLKDLELVKGSSLTALQKIAVINSITLAIKFRLVYGFASQTFCGKIDTTIRVAVKDALHLCAQYPDAALYTKAVLGGLGIINLQDTVPLEQANLVTRMMKSVNLTTRTLVDDKIHEVILEKYGIKCGVSDLYEKESIDKIRNHLSKEITGGFIGTTYGEGWSCYRDAPRKFIEQLDEKDYTMLLKMKANILACMSLTYRFGNTQSPLCRYGCQTEETLGHILSLCPRVKYLQTERHDRVCRYIRKLLINCSGKPVKVSKDRYSITVRSSEGSSELEVGKRFEPDIVFENEKSIVIIEIAVPFEREYNGNDPAQNSLIARRNKKVDKYKPLVNLLAKRTSKTVHLNTLIVGARGGWIPSCSKVLRGTGVEMSSLIKNQIVHRAVKGSIRTYSKFISDKFIPFTKEARSIRNNHLSTSIMN